MKSLVILVVILTSCTAKIKTEDAIPRHQTFTLESKLLSEKRVINVWIPRQYAEKSASFPVLYMADGGLKEDFPHLANTLSKLITEKKIPPIILVGIENTQRRRDLTGFTEVEEDKKIAAVVGESVKFRSFIKEELFPEINKKYRTTEKRAIIGESLAGLFVVETFLTNPEMFNQYIAIDPSLWWNNHQLTTSAKDHLSKLQNADAKKLWFASSGERDIFTFTQQFSETLQFAQLPNLKWKYMSAPQEKHTTIFRAVKEKALIWTLNSN